VLFSVILLTVLTVYLAAIVTDVQVGHTIASMHETLGCMYILR